MKNNGNNKYLFYNNNNNQVKIIYESYNLFDPPTYIFTETSHLK